MITENMEKIYDEKADGFKEFNLSKKIQTLEGLFNEFLRKWTGSDYPHLIDSDENDGEKFREKLWEIDNYFKEFIRLCEKLSVYANHKKDIKQLAWGDMAIRIVDLKRLAGNKLNGI